MSDPVHTLYRFYGAKGELLYVGRTVDARSRWRSHERDKSWFAAVAVVRREVFATAEALGEAEVRAIRDDRPLHNVVHNHRAGAAAHVVPLLPTPTSRNELISARASVLGEFEVDCGDPYAESSCECLACHHLRLAEFESIEEEFSLDQKVQDALAVLWAQYAGGDCALTWIADLWDLRLFRVLAMSFYGRISPAPAFATATGAGLELGCPFCGGLHEHFLPSGAPLEALDGPCRMGSSYVPITHFDHANDAFVAWLADMDKHAAIAA